MIAQSRGSEFAPSNHTHPHKIERRPTRSATAVACLRGQPLHGWSPWNISQVRDPGSIGYLIGGGRGARSASRWTQDKLLCCRDYSVAAAPAAYGTRGLGTREV